VALMFTREVKDRIQAELQQAHAARESGNEGRARVCARRAAGIAVQAYFDHMQVPYPAGSKNALDFLTRLRGLDQAPAEIHEIAGHLLTRVNPDYQLPIQADLLAETEVLVSRIEALIQERR